jgi:1-aminocyclopropane-1-carboxylate deaminase
LFTLVLHKKWGEFQQIEQTRMYLTSLFDLNVEDESFQHPILIQQQIDLKVRRFDTIHLQAGGNKIFKLQNWLNNIEEYKTVISFGGAFSNHLLALSSVAKKLGIKSVGIIRGEKPVLFNHYLNAFVENGMELIFVSRTNYKGKTEIDFLNEMKLRFPYSLIIPEGGAGVNGINGAKEMVNEFEPYDFIVLPCATGTTLAGIALKNRNCQIIGFQVLKGENAIQNELLKSTNMDISFLPNLTINDSYHFGGYAKVNAVLLDFQQKIFESTQIPFDKAYGIKAIYGLFEEIKKGKFELNNRILYLHTGGTFDFINR